jgi:hypothetical protein
MKESQILFNAMLHEIVIEIRGDNRKPTSQILSVCARKMKYKLKK